MILLFRKHFIFLEYAISKTLFLLFKIFHYTFIFLKIEDR